MSGDYVLLGVAHRDREAPQALERSLSKIRSFALLVLKTTAAAAAAAAAAAVFFARDRCMGRQRTLKRPGTMSKSIASVEQAPVHQLSTRLLSQKVFTLSRGSACPKETRQ